MTVACSTSCKQAYTDECEAWTVTLRRRGAAACKQAYTDECKCEAMTAMISPFSKKSDMIMAMAMVMMGLVLLLVCQLCELRLLAHALSSNAGFLLIDVMMDARSQRAGTRCVPLMGRPFLAAFLCAPELVFAQVVPPLDQARGWSLLRSLRNCILLPTPSGRAIWFKLGLRHSGGTADLLLGWLFMVFLG